MEEGSQRLVNFFFEMGMLKKTPRTGYQFLGSGGESVADHCFRAAIIGYCLAKKVKGVDPNKVILMCLFHDIPESRTGDHNYMNKRYVRCDEYKVLDDQLEGLPFGGEIRAIFQEFNEGQTMEAMLARDADQLDLILELKAQLELGNKQAQDWIYYAIKRLKTEIGKEVADEVLNISWTDWWFEKKTDWWINCSDFLKGP